jgi:hypothetical protein
MKLWLTGIAVPATALALAFGAPALAQDNDMPMDEPAMQHQSDIEIDPMKPFGEIDISMFGEDDAAHQAWIEGLSEEQRNELKDRCIKILGDPQITVDDASKSFCDELDTYYQEDF